MLAWLSGPDYSLKFLEVASQYLKALSALGSIQLSRKNTVNSGIL